MSSTVIMLLYLLALAVLWMLIVNGIWHTVRSTAIRREAKHPAAGSTTNGRSRFIMEIGGVVNGLTGVTVSGSVRGIMPIRGNVVLLQRREQTFPVYITAVRLLDMPEVEAGVRATLTLFGARGLQPAAGDVLTNVRVKRGTAPEVPTVADIHWPVTVHRCPRDYLTALLPIAIGGVMAGITALALARGYDTSDSVLVLAVVSALMMAFGLFMLADCLLFRLLLTEDGQVTVRSPGKSISNNIMNLSFRIYLSEKRTQRWCMDVLNAGGQKLATVDEDAPGFAEARAAFMQAQHRRGEERLYRYLAEHEFFVPVAVLQDAATGAAVTMPAMMTHKETGAPGIFLYETEDLLNGRTPTVRRETMRVTLAQMAELIGGFSSGGEILVFLANPNLPRTVAVNAANWQELQKFITP